MHNIEKNNKILKEEEKNKIDARMEKIEDKLLESRSYTPVTRETFDKWFKEYYAKNCKKDKTKLEQEGRISGREFFMNLKSKNITELDQESPDEDEIQEEVDEKKKEGKNKEEIFFDENVFDENLDDLDFEENDS